MILQFMPSVTYLFQKIKGKDSVSL